MMRRTPLYRFMNLLFLLGIVGVVVGALAMLTGHPGAWKIASLGCVGYLVPVCWAYNKVKKERR